MKKRIGHLSFFPLLSFLITSCVTINIYFPAAAVEKAADKIVQDTWGKEAPKPEKKQGKQQGLLDHGSRHAGLTFGITEAYAEEADINVTTPAIRSLKASIKGRSESIKPYMNRGHVGITNDGLLVIRTDQGLSLKEKATLTRLIKAENRDREALYLEIAKANNFAGDRVADIKRIFANSWIKNAQPGWWVQQPDGVWKQK